MVVILSLGWVEMGYGRGDEVEVGEWGGILAVTDYHTVRKNVIHDCIFKAFCCCLLLSCTFFI